MSSLPVSPDRPDPPPHDPGAAAAARRRADAALARLLREQGGVVARRQLLEAGCADHDVRRAVRRRQLAPVHPGVLVEHTGPLTWVQRAWAAVLWAGPGAALHGSSALRAADGPGGRHDDAGPVHVAVPAHRQPETADGVVVHRTRGLHTRVQAHLGPPRVRYAEAALDVALEALASGDQLAAVAALATAVGGRRTTAVRLAASLAGRRRVRGRAFVAGVLADVAEGTCSVLEHGFLTRVLRAHGLPEGTRQVPAALTLGRGCRDVGLLGTWVELDGRLHHGTTEQRDRDLDRDLDAAVDVDGQRTVRLGYGQVFRRPCATAARLAALLPRADAGLARPCSPGCPVGG